LTFSSSFLFFLFFHLFLSLPLPLPLLSLFSYYFSFQAFSLGAILGFSPPGIADRGRRRETRKVSSADLGQLERSKLAI
jgi:hypothetical protein